MKKVKIKYVPGDRVKVLNSCVAYKEQIQSISMTEGVFTFMRGTAIVEMEDENFSSTLENFKRKLESVCSKGLKVTVL